MKIPQIFLIIFFIAISSCDKIAEKENYPSLADPQYELLSRENKISYLDSIKSTLNASSNSKKTRDFYFTMATQYYYLNEPKKSNRISRIAFNLAENANDTTDIARAYYYIGDTYEVTQKDSAYYYYLEAEKLYRLKNQKNDIARMLFNKAYILFFEGNYVESEIELAKALQLLINTEAHDLLYSSYTLMGANMEKLEEYDDALKYYHFAQELMPELEKNNTDFDRQHNYKIVLALNLGNIYEKQGKYAKSVDQLEKYLTPEIRNHWPSEYSKVLSNLAYSKMKGGDLENVEAMFLQALELSEKYSNSNALLYKLNNLGEYYLLQNDYANAKKYLKRSLLLSEKIRSGEEIKTALKLLSRADTANSATYENRYLFLNDSLAKAQRRNRNKYARIEYETVLLEGQNKTLSEKYSSILIVLGLLVITIIFLLGLRYFTNQKRALQAQRQKQLADEEIFELLKEQQIKILQTKEQEQNRISRDLHDGILNKIYGVRLQLGILNRSDDMDVKAKRMKYIDMLQEIEKEIRALSHDLHVDKMYDQFDFKSLLSNLVTAQNDLGSTQFTLDVDEEINWNTVSGLIKITIYRILQEASLNVIKYAEAGTCTIVLKQQSANELLFVITDNGKGFDVNSAGGGIGLKNMRARAKDINAQLKMDSALGKGTQIELQIKI